ncbi:MAG: hypothetical protein JO097_00305 [Acidobacteriaceae bacterium]|nr:hypothetical protein [Acidobacteriaceae bacterium]MBV9765400.1 hypothetical protein [Acidobacteriaceae bacterium]
MREQIEARLAALRSEHEKGQVQLQQLQNQANGMRDTMLRISGAIMVLEELLSSHTSAPAEPDNRHQPITITTEDEPSARDGRFTATNKEH